MKRRIGLGVGMHPLPQSILKFKVSETLSPAFSSGSILLVSPGGFVQSSTVGFTTGKILFPATNRRRELFCLLLKETWICFNHDTV